MTDGFAKKFTIEIDVSRASQVATLELHQEIESFLSGLTVFDYESRTDNIKNGNKHYFATSVNP